MTFDARRKLQSKSYQNGNSNKQRNPEETEEGMASASSMDTCSSGVSTVSEGKIMTMPKVFDWLGPKRINPQAWIKWEVG